MIDHTDWPYLVISIAGAWTATMAWLNARRNGQIGQRNAEIVQELKQDGEKRGEQLTGIHSMVNGDVLAKLKVIADQSRRIYELSGQHADRATWESHQTALDLAVTRQQAQWEQGIREPYEILVIDDDKVMCELMEAMSEPFNCHLTFAHTGQEGLSLALERRFWKIVLDLKLAGGMDGVEVFRRLTVAKVETPVLVFSGYLTTEMHEAISKIGHCVFMPKDAINAPPPTCLFSLIGVPKKPPTSSSYKP